jgi:hypothetical protein
MRSLFGAADAGRQCAPRRPAVVIVRPLNFTVRQQKSHSSSPPPSAEVL